MGVPGKRYSSFGSYSHIAAGHVRITPTIIVQEQPDLEQPAKENEAPPPRQTLEEAFLQSGDDRLKIIADADIGLDLLKPLKLERDLSVVSIHHIICPQMGRDGLLHGALKFGAVVLTRSEHFKESHA